MTTIKFYSRPNCELCKDGYLMLKLALEDLNLTAEVINIEQDEAAHEKYMLMIPVVERDGEVVQYGKLDYVTLLEGLQ